MRTSSPVADYLDALSRALSFDAVLARRVRCEVEDHLSEAAAAAAAGQEPSIEAQHRALAKFGDARDIAQGYLAASLFRQTRRNGVIALLVIAGIFGIMELRMAYYGSAPLEFADDVQRIRALVLPIGGYAFKLALVSAVLGAVYIACRRVPAQFHRAYDRELRRYFGLCAVGVAALIASVLSDAVLTATRLSATVPPSALVPVLSMAVEIAFAGGFIVHLRRTLRHMACAATLSRI
jgi:hypothetical protein